MAAAPALGRLGPLYKDIGLDTNPEVVAGRLKVAQAQLRKLGSSAIVPLVKAALGLAKPDELVDFVSPYQAADPTFVPDKNNREVPILAAALLSDIVAGSGDLAERTALIVCTASFGGARAYPDPELWAHAELSLTRLQTKLRAAPPDVTYHKVPDTQEKLANLDSQAAANNFQAALTDAKELIAGLSAHTEKAVLDLARQLQAMHRHQQRLQEEMNAQWWVMGAWSASAHRPFKDVSLPEAAILAGRELAGMTKTAIGMPAAPALTNRVIEQDRKPPLTKTSIFGAVGSSTSEYLAVWTGNLSAEAPATALLPLTLAAVLAKESDGSDDWKPRFKRLAGFSADTKLSPNDLAVQAYREALTVRLLEA